MNHIIALVIKFVMVAAVLLIVLTWIFNLSFVDTLLISLALTASSYVLGDLLIFLNAGKPENQETRNAIATVMDFIMSFAVIWVIGWLLTNQTAELVTPALVGALIITAGEWFFHQYMDQRVVPWYNNYKRATGP